MTGPLLTVVVEVELVCDGFTPDEAREVAGDRLIDAGFRVRSTRVLDEEEVSGVSDR